MGAVLAPSPPSFLLCRACVAPTQPPVTCWPAYTCTVSTPFSWRLPFWSSLGLSIAWIPDFVKDDYYLPLTIPLTSHPLLCYNACHAGRLPRFRPSLLLQATIHLHRRGMVADLHPNPPPPHAEDRELGLKGGQSAVLHPLNRAKPPISSFPLTSAPTCGMMSSSASRLLSPPAKLRTVCPTFLRSDAANV